MSIRASIRSLAALWLMRVAALIIVMTASIDVRAERVETARDTVTDVCEVFVNFPDKYLSIIPKATRLDMADYLKVDSLARVRNVYRGESWIESYTPEYISVHITDVSSLCIKRLTDHKGRHIFAAIYTIGGEGIAADSQLLFFNEFMEPVETRKFFKTPDPKNFWKVAESDSRKDEIRELLDRVPFYAIEYTLSPDNDILTGRITSTAYLTEEQRAAIEPLLVSHIRWHWTGKRFSPASQR